VSDGVPRRDYAGLAASVGREAASLSNREERIRVVVRQLWERLSGENVDWLGFYEIAPGRDSMLLVCCEPGPACSPIGLHGVCGRAWLERRPQVVEDVHALGEAHIDCDPANLSEVVVPCMEVSGRCWGVLDLDSRSRGAFSGVDADGLRRVLEAAGLSSP